MDLKLHHKPLGARFLQERHKKGDKKADLQSGFKK